MLLRISSFTKQDLCWPFEKKCEIILFNHVLAFSLSVLFPQKEKASSSRPPSQQQSIQPQLKRPSSLTDLSHAHEEQEVEFLKLQVSEQRGIIDELTQVRILLKPPQNRYSLYIHIYQNKQTNILLKCGLILKCPKSNCY